MQSTFFHSFGHSGNLSGLLLSGCSKCGEILQTNIVSKNDLFWWWGGREQLAEDGGPTSRLHSITSALSLRLTTTWVTEIDNFT